MNTVEKNRNTQGKRYAAEVMSSGNRRQLIAGVSLFLFFAMVIPSLQMLAQGPRVIEIAATSDNKFKVAGQKQAVITVKPKEVIKFRITSKWGDEKDPKWPGCPHSFSIKGFEDQGWNKCLKEGMNEFVLVAPAAPGTYKIECLAKCGKGHDDMAMKMIVQ